MSIQLSIDKSMSKHFKCVWLLHMVVVIVFSSSSVYGQTSPNVLSDYIRALNIEIQAGLDLYPAIRLRQATYVNSEDIILLFEVDNIETTISDVGDDYFCILRNDQNTVTRFCANISDIAYIIHDVPRSLPDAFPVFPPQENSNGFEKLFWQIHQTVIAARELNEHMTILQLYSPENFQLALGDPERRASIVLVGGNYFCVEQFSEPNDTRFCIPYTNFQSIIQTAPIRYFSESWYTKREPLSIQSTLSRSGYGQKQGS